MYTTEIFDFMNKHENRVAFSEYLNIYKNSPQVKGVTYNGMKCMYEMKFSDTEERLYFQIYNG